MAAILRNFLYPFPPLFIAPGRFLLFGCAVLFVAAAAVWLVPPAIAGEGGSAWEQERLRMLAAIREDVEETSFYIKKEKLDEKVLAAMARVPRHEFVPAQFRGEAYLNVPLPIGYGQTISQPYIVALMTDLLQVGTGDRVLEIGTGSGYQAALLAELGALVRTMEIIEPLGKQAGERLQRLGYRNASVRTGDGYYGWPEEGPFDAIMVTAAASHIPPPLVAQLKPGGRLVVPVGSSFMVQQLVLVQKNPAGVITTEQILPVRFVPLTGGH